MGIGCDVDEGETNWGRLIFKKKKTCVVKILKFVEKDNQSKEVDNSSSIN